MDSCLKFNVFAFSTAENRLCRTPVRRRDDFRRFCIFSLTKSREPKPEQTQVSQTEISFTQHLESIT